MELLHHSTLDVECVVSNLVFVYFDSICSRGVVSSLRPRLNDFDNNLKKNVLHMK